MERFAALEKLAYLFFFFGLVFFRVGVGADGSLVSSPVVFLPVYNGSNVGLML